MLKIRKWLAILLAVMLVCTSVAALPVNAADTAEQEDAPVAVTEETQAPDDALPAEGSTVEKEEPALQASGAEADAASEGANNYQYEAPVITGFESVDAGVKITWKSLGAERYRAYYKGKNGWTAMGTTPHNYFYDTDVASGKTYIYSIRCVSAGGKYDTSPMNTAGWKYTYNMDTPKITGFRSLDSGVKITWSKVANAKKYRVFYYGSKGWTSMGDTASTSFVDTDVSSGTTYTYSVRCLKSDGSRYTSDMNTSGWKYTYNMDTPKITGLTSTASGINITWTKVNNASRYAILYYGSSGWRKMVTTTATSYLDTDVRFGNSYTYSVRCINANGRYTSGFDASGWKIKHYLATPKITKTTSSASGVTLTWNRVAGAVKYRTYYLNRYDNWVKMGDTTGTSFLDDDVSYGSTYTYTVRCITADGNTFTSDYDHSGWKHTYYLSTPTITSFSSLGNGVRIEWKSVGAVKYRVYYYGSRGWTSMGETTATAFIDDDVRVGKTYRYTVRAINKDGSRFTSDYDDTGKQYTYNPKLSAPVIKSCETVSGGVKITWGMVTGAYKYRVYYRNKNGNWVKMGDTAGLSFIDDDVSSGSTYTYAVRCLAAKSDEFASGYSAAKSHTYKVSSSFMIACLWSTEKGVQISWRGQTNVKRYRIYYKNSSGSWVKMVDTSNTAYLDTDVRKGNSYTYTVRCLDSSGNPYGEYDTIGLKCTYTGTRTKMTESESKTVANRYWFGTAGQSDGLFVRSQGIDGVQGNAYYVFHLMAPVYDANGNFLRSSPVDYLYINTYTGECRTRMV